MSAFRRPSDRVVLLDITNRSGQHQHVNYSYSLRPQDSEAQLAANVMGNQHRPHIKRLEMQGSAEPSELNCRYNARTTKNIIDSRGAHSWLDANPEVYKMMQTSLELLMSRSRKVHPPNLPDSTYGGELQKVTNSQVHGIAQPSDVHKMVQTSLEMEMLTSQSRNVCPANLPGSTYGGESASVASPQVDGTAYLYRGIDDDLPPPNLNSTDMRGTGHVSGNGRAITPTSSYDTAQTAMEAHNVNPLIGRKAMNRWPDDNNFYEVVISDYNQETGLYALVHDMNTSNETWEWVDLKKMGQEDIRWQEDGSGIDPVMYLQSQGARTSGAGKSTSHGGPKCSWKRNKFPEECIQEGFLPPQNVDETRSYNNINIFHTGSLIKVVKKIFSVSNPDPLEVERAKKALEDQERSLVGAIARLAEASDVASG